jgi:hypothetical protein
MVKIVSEMAKFVKTELTPDTMALYGKKLVIDFHNYTIEEMILAINRGIAGQYGKIYGSVSYDVVCEWLYAYWQEREDFQYREHLSRKSEFKTPINDELIKNIKIPTPEKITQPAQQNRAKTSHTADMVQGWIKKFDKIALKTEHSGSIRFINRYGRMLDVNEYLNHKMEQYQRTKKRHHAP